MLTMLFVVQLSVITQMGHDHNITGYNASKNVHRDVSMLWTYQSLLEINDKFIIIYK